MPRSKNEKVEPYVKLDYIMTESAAWTCLSDRAIWLYIELRKSFRVLQGGNSSLRLSYSKISWRMSRGSFCRAMKELRNFGFLKVIEQGGLLRKPTIYALSEQWKEISRSIVDKEGREAIKLGLAKKSSSRDHLDNLRGRRRWES